MIETFERLIGLLNDNSNLMIIKTYQNLLWGEYVNINLNHNLEINNIPKDFEARVYWHYYHGVK